MTAHFRDVERCLEENSSNVEAAAQKLAKNPRLIKHVEVMKVREALQERLSSANPSSLEIEHAILAAQEATKEVMEQAEQRRAAANVVAEKAADLKEQLAA